MNALTDKQSIDSSSINESLLFLFFSHGFSDPGGDAGYASDVEQLQSASQRQDQANAVERHVRHSCKMEEVSNLNLFSHIETQIYLPGLWVNMKAQSFLDHLEDKKRS